MPARGRLLPLALPLIMAVPVAAGMGATLAPALALRQDAGPAPLITLLAWPGLPEAALLSLRTGLVSTAIALALVLLALAALQGTRLLALLIRLVSPLLAVPHAAAALGLAFLIAPSGWIARALSPWATGWQAPPDLLILNDPGGWALTFGLVAKEVPFLLLMALAALPQTDAARRMAVAESLGRGRTAAFALTVLPALYPQLRLPVYAVLAYGMTAVEMALILGPTLPPTLSAQIVLWMADADLAQRGLASAGALVQLALVGVALLLWRGAEGAARAVLVRAAEAGLRGAGWDRVARGGAGAVLALAAGGLVAGLAGLALWSVAGPWTFPDAWPAGLTLATWDRAGDDLKAAGAMTLALALASSGLALALVLAGLRTGLDRAGAGATALLYLPLIVPQVAFLPGLQALALRSGAMGGPGAVALAHAVFVLPYVYLSLAPAWRALDPRIEAVGASLGASPSRIFWRLRMPLLLRPVLTAAAVGIAVSVGQYLPTLAIGGGRVETLTTAAVALSAGGNRRIIGAYGLLQMALPAMAFALALAVPALAFRNRRGMAATAATGQGGAG